MTGRERVLGQLRAALGVSRETCGRIDAYVELLLKWTKSINLISKSSAEEIWTRHVADSTQLWALRPAAARHWLDLGAGGGLPGLVIAILAAELAPEMQVTLIESDLRKAAFLQTAARDLGLPVRILAERIEAAPPQDAEVISARALAPLAELLAMAERHAAPGAILLFPKGRSAAEELTAARAIWHVDAEAIPSQTDPASAILRIGDFRRV